MAGGFHERQACRFDFFFHLGDAGAVLFAFRAAFLQVADAGGGGGGDGRRQRGGEDETGGVTADEVNDVPGGGDVAANDAVGFGQGAFNDVHLGCDAVTLADAAAARAVHADGVHFIQVGEGVVLFGDGDDVGDGRDVAVHGVHRFKNHDLRLRGRQGGKVAAQVGGVVVAEDDFFRAAAADAFNHGCMVFCVGQNNAVRQP